MGTLSPTFRSRRRNRVPHADRPGHALVPTTGHRPGAAGHIVLRAWAVIDVMSWISSPPPGSVSSQPSSRHGLIAVPTALRDAPIIWESSS